MVDPEQQATSTDDDDVQEVGWVRASGKFGWKPAARFVRNGLRTLTPRKRNVEEAGFTEETPPKIREAETGVANKYKELVQKTKAMKGDGKLMMEELKEERTSDTKDVGTEATDAAINGDGRKEELMKEDGPELKSDTTKGVPGTEATDVGMEEEEELMKEDSPRVISDTMKVKDMPGTDAALNEMKEELKEELKLMKEELMKMMKEELMEMKEELRQAVAMKEHPVAMMKEQKPRKGQLNGRQAAALALQKVKTVTCRLCDWDGCGSDVGFKKHMAVKHGNVSEYWLIPPREAEEANEMVTTFKTDDVVRLVHPGDKTDVAEGKVVMRTVCHGNQVENDELAVVVLKLLAIGEHGEVLHPKYSYPIENGGYTSWKIMDCLKAQ